MPLKASAVDVVPGASRLESSFASPGIGSVKMPGAINTEKDSHIDSRRGAYSMNKALTRLTSIRWAWGLVSVAANSISNGVTRNQSSTLPIRHLNIHAATAGSVGSARDSHKESFAPTENVAPYALMGDIQGDYAAWTPPLVSQSVDAAAHPPPNAGGTAGGGVTVSFTVIPQ